MAKSRIDIIEYVKKKESKEEFSTSIHVNFDYYFDLTDGQRKAFCEDILSTFTHISISISFSMGKRGNTYISDILAAIGSSKTVRVLELGNVNNLAEPYAAKMVSAVISSKTLEELSLGYTKETSHNPYDLRFLSMIFLNRVLTGRDFVSFSLTGFNFQKFDIKEAIAFSETLSTSKGLHQFSLTECVLPDDLKFIMDITHRSPHLATISFQANTCAPVFYEILATSRIPALDVSCTVFTDESLSHFVKGLEQFDKDRSPDQFRVLGLSEIRDDVKSVMRLSYYLKDTTSVRELRVCSFGDPSVSDFAFCHAVFGALQFNKSIKSLCFRNGNYFSLNAFGWLRPMLLQNTTLIKLELPTALYIFYSDDDYKNFLDALAANESIVDTGNARVKEIREKRPGRVEKLQEVITAKEKKSGAAKAIGQPSAPASDHRAITQLLRSDGSHPADEKTVSRSEAPRPKKEKAEEAEDSQLSELIKAFQDHAPTVSSVSKLTAIQSKNLTSAVSVSSQASDLRHRARKGQTG